MYKYVLSIKDDQIQAVLLSQKRKHIKLQSNRIIYSGLEDGALDVTLLHQNEAIVEKAKAFIGETAKRSRTVDIVVGVDNVITRTVVLPYLNKRDLQDYIANNISSYFAVNLESYYFDYRVLQISRKEDLTSRTMTVLVAIIPSAILLSIRHFTEMLGQKLGKILIYPDVMQSFAVQDKSLAIIDIGQTKCIVTIFEQDRLFLFASINQGIGEVEGVDDLLNEIEHLAGFFASKHQGRNLDIIFIIGNHQEGARLARVLTARFDVLNDGIDVKKWQRITSLNNLQSCADVIASQVDRKPIYGKLIDFSVELKKRTTSKKRFEPSHLALILLILTAVWILPYWHLLNVQKTAFLPLEPPVEFTEMNTQLKRMKEELKILRQKEKVISKIEGDQADIVAVTDQLLQAVPSNITVDKLMIEPGRVSVSFNIEKSTMDAIDLVIAINELKYFKEVSIEELALDDSNDELSLELTVR